jgi:hypothetical protein
MCRTNSEVLDVEANLNKATVQNVSEKYYPPTRERFKGEERI